MSGLLLGSFWSCRSRGRVAERGLVCPSMCCEHPIGWVSFIKCSVSYGISLSGLVVHYPSSKYRSVWVSCRFYQGSDAGLEYVTELWKKMLLDLGFDLRYEHGSSGCMICSSWSWFRSELLVGLATDCQRVCDAGYCHLCYSLEDKLSANNVVDTLIWLDIHLCFGSYVSCCSFFRRDKEYAELDTLAWLIAMTIRIASMYSAIWIARAFSPFPASYSLLKCGNVLDCVVEKAG